MKYNEKEYKLSLTGYTLVIYKEKFHKDLFAALIELEKGIDVVNIMEIIWALAKSSDKTIPDFDEFANSITDIGSFISKETIEELTNVITNSTTRNVKTKKD